MGEVAKTSRKRCLHNLPNSFSRLRSIVSRSHKRYYSQDWPEEDWQMHQTCKESGIDFNIVDHLGSGLWSQTVPIAKLWIGQTSKEKHAQRSSSQIKTFITVLSSILKRRIELPDVHDHFHGLSCSGFLLGVCPGFRPHAEKLIVRIDWWRQ